MRQLYQAGSFLFKQMLEQTLKISEMRCEQNQASPSGMSSFYCKFVDFGITIEIQ